jgi:hypothetical protein
MTVVCPSTPAAPLLDLTALQASYTRRFSIMNGLFVVSVDLHQSRRGRLAPTGPGPARGGPASLNMGGQHASSRQGMASAPAQAPVATSRRVVQPPGARQTASGSPMSGAGLGAGELSVSWRGLEESRSCSPCLGRSSEPVHRSANDPPVLIIVDCPPVWLLARPDELDADPKPGDAACDGMWRGERSSRGQARVVSDQASFRFAAACFPHSACGSAWNRDPVSGVIGVQTGPP